ncbi:OmpP1/FadL family transporter [Chryseosolibacter indicus]|uniref:Long-subunit fatty acid transport protein n=1 Tax=Chryseosolibacter indicus TaxID=2782351 RepID=A0ABS5VSC2_9BACT|nr:hypothetical protein [Chryseosolibacter indicus]MBT1704338.1 hypothetical protein [Chryseosolibacter indicus]
MSKLSLRYFLIVTVLLSGFNVYSQSYAERGFLFSQVAPPGSARIQALGGSQIALGGDYSSALSNPAGLGMYNRNEFTFSTALSSHSANTNYLGNKNSESKSVFNIPGISYVGKLGNEKDGFLGGAVGVSFSRRNDYNRSIRIGGFNANNSIIDYFIDQANGRNTDQFDEGALNYNTPTGLAYFNYLIGSKSILNPPGPANEYFTDAGYPEQLEETEVKGASNQWSISYGANFHDKFFIGGGVGITTIRYQSERNFQESFNSDTLEYLNLVENLDIKGTGINATLGAIARPVDFLQIGVSYTTPTVYSMSQNYDASMSSIWNNFDYYGDGSEILGDNSNDPIFTDIVTSEYRLTVPSRLSAGIALISKYGFITGDVEMTNPGNTKYRADTRGISYASENDDIKAVYTSSLNYRFGAEYRFSIFRLRAGYGVQGNTYKDYIDSSNNIRTISGGFGIRKKEFYIDFALVNRQGDTLYQPYTFSDGSGPISDQTIKTTTGMLTFGFIF